MRIVVALRVRNNETGALRIRTTGCDRTFTADDICKSFLGQTILIIVVKSLVYECNVNLNIFVIKMK
jgi:hypothetical protein